MDNLFFRRVLLVEDEGLTRSAMKSLILSSEPTLDIDEAGSYEEAVERLQRDAYDLIFLDYQLGREHTGLELLHWVQQQELSLHVVMLSARDDRETVLDCIKNGAGGFISKASEEGGAVFREALQTILNGRVYLPNSVLGKGGHTPQAPAPSKGIPIDSLNLPPRLAQTLRYVLHGLSNKAIARKMSITENTAKEYISDLLSRFNVSRRTFLIVEMARRGIEIPTAAQASAS
ncbi:two-component system nitrate/nitrite response regulator NarL [Paraburkholderia youngii]|uniref:DNA-binding NarL/FixJ family response regulator n=1 Tax=Paraburkholderia youngii TaxID=2782701 RepID=A0A7W8P0I1_9BURK|nr:response regulator transcription factor [Paraburkholderia youngii]MBB5399106.1 DNA-binding NarL/FixJ family response regulator [Paraburkholderia youngii]NUX56136.1 response regulator transcription factor [Paraburkholderia youngii]NVI07850.1 response regulator transcription factor [Paraburkholderia youngii]